MKYDKLIENAIQAQKNSYAPYSNFKVGASIIDNENNIYRGCNVENASYGLSNCAERSARFNAISNGSENLIALAIYTNTNNFTYPCGACRQVIIEFNPNMEIILINKKKERKIIKATQLLPNSFNTNNIK